MAKFSHGKVSDKQLEGLVGVAAPCPPSATPPVIFKLLRQTTASSISLKCARLIRILYASRLTNHDFYKKVMNQLSCNTFTISTSLISSKLQLHAIPGDKNEAIT